MNEKLIIGVLRLIFLIIAASYLFYLGQTYKELDVIMMALLLTCFVSDFTKVIKEITGSSRSKSQ